MAAIVHFTSLVLLLTLASANPYYDFDRWTPDEIAAFLYQGAEDQFQRAVDQFSGPAEDSSFNTDGQGLGMTSGVAVDSKGDLFVFHRADKPWTSTTFELVGDMLTADGRIPISKDTIFVLDPSSGRLKNSWGANFFNVPHGLTIDSNDNVWVTDVGRHQVFRFPKNSTTPDLILGEKFVPGSDDSHFCKPTDVAVASNGDFFVADGYCNSRVLKYSKDGKVLTQWGTQTSGSTLTPFSLFVPHSITLIEELNLVCVADRENRRGLCYNAGLNSDQTGSFNKTLIPQDDMGKVFAIYYNKAEKDVIAAGEISRVPLQVNGQDDFPPRAFTYGLDGVQQEAWAYITPDIAAAGPSLIHDLCASNDGTEFFLADIVQQKIFKYIRQQPPIVG